jgi:hypothetical protein
VGKDHFLLHIKKIGEELVLGKTAFALLFPGGNIGKY